MKKCPNCKVKFREGYNHCVVCNFDKLGNIPPVKKWQKCPVCTGRINPVNNCCNRCELIKGSDFKHDTKHTYQNWFVLVGVGIGVLSFVILIIMIPVSIESNENITYVCHGGPTHWTMAETVITVTTIEARGQNIIRWIDQDTFERQVYIDHYWGRGWHLSDEDIRGWFEGPYNVMEFTGMYWELMELTEDYVITRIIWNYHEMYIEDLNMLWHGDVVRYASREGSVNGLIDQGATCVQQ